MDGGVAVGSLASEVISGSLFQAKVQSAFYVGIIALGCVSVRNQSINTYIHV